MGNNSAHLQFAVLSFCKNLRGLTAWRLLQSDRVTNLEGGIVTLMVHKIRLGKCMDIEYSFMIA